MAKAPKAFDVWFLSANTVYKAVPYGVVADWAQQGRLAATDMVKVAGSTGAWTAVSADELLADYLPRATSARVAVPAEPAAAATAEPGQPVHETPVELPEPEELSFRRPPGEEDDDVDMIPLIDVSMVLLVFFILMRAAGALAPVDVPEMRYAGQPNNDPNAISINIDKKNADTVLYSVHKGQTPPTPDHDNLPTPESAIAALKDMLAGSTQPPVVRIACHKDLPRERVYELSRELEPLVKSSAVSSYEATVIEAPQKK